MLIQRPNAAHLVPVVLVSLLAACSSSSPTTPSPTPRAVVTLTVTAVTVARTNVGYDYGFTVTAKETGGVAATLDSMNVTLFSATGSRGTTNITAPFAVTSLPANGSQPSKSITLTETTTDPIAAVRLTVAVALNDAVGALSATVDATVTALPLLFTLSGTVSVAAPFSSTRLPGTRVEIEGGPHAGKSAITDGAGAFSITGLTGDVSARASLAGYVDQTISATMSQDRSVSFGLAPQQGDIDETLTGTLSSGTATTCSDGTFTRPCETFTIPIFYSGNLSAELDWGSTGNDLDLTLWHDTILIASSKNFEKPEVLSFAVTGGQTYFIKVTYYNGSTPESFSVKVTRPR